MRANLHSERKRLQLSLLLYCKFSTECAGEIIFFKLVNILQRYGQKYGEIGDFFDSRCNDLEILPRSSAVYVSFESFPVISYIYVLSFSDWT